MHYKELAKTGEKLSVVGLGCMGMSAAYGTADDIESVATLQHALDLGINFWDTADIYGDGSQYRYEERRNPEPEMGKRRFKKRLHIAQSRIDQERRAERNSD